VRREETQRADFPFSLRVKDLAEAESKLASSIRHRKTGKNT
jgi:hypothetical protein